MSARRSFGATWWGQAWIDALEHRARLDPNRLPRGRTYARQNRARTIRLEAGSVTATVAGRRPSPYTVRVRLRPFDADEWDRLLGAVAARAGHAAALLDGDLDPGIVEDARAVGVELLPDAGELQPRCSCPDWADPCKHAAAVCYLVADELDADPFALFELRGRDRDQVLADLRRRRSVEGAAAGGGGGSGPPASASDVGMTAQEAWSRALARLPDPPPPGDRPGKPAPWSVDPPLDAPFSAAGLRVLAADAATRAWRMARGEGCSELDLGPDADEARRAADALGGEGFEELASRSELAPVELARRAVAWRHAGSDGLRALSETRWRPPPTTMAAARDAVVAAGVPRSRIRVDGNRVAIGADVQLRLGRDGRWYRFKKHAGRWQLGAPPADEPDELVEVSASG
ncbi:MAG: SWIM zinc finger family protein [Actinobacteria bacterium]|nr:SWIM zinc finger family protein [Actinomycetota bacterium]